MKKINFILVLLLCVLLSGCAAFMPVYNLQYSDKNGYTIDVFGVTYREMQEFDWRPIFQDDVLVGSQKNLDGGNTGILVYMSRADEKKVFVITKTSKFLFNNGVADSYYSRSDIILPPYDSNGIDMIGFKKINENEYKTIQDKKIIKQLLDLKKITQNNPDLDYVDTIHNMQFMNSNYPGIGIPIKIELSKTSYWVAFNDFYSRVPIAQNLLESIVGEKLPTPSEYIASQQKIAG